MRRLWLWSLWGWCSKSIDQKVDTRSVCPPRVGSLGRLCLLFQELWGWALPVICKKDLNHLLNNRYITRTAYESFLFFHFQDFDRLSLNLVFGNPKGYNISYPIFIQVLLDIFPSCKTLFEVCERVGNGKSTFSSFFVRQRTFDR